ncbi:hypothetical protein AAHE18_18G165500 [Arachis hypogaea]
MKTATGAEERGSSDGLTRRCDGDGRAYSDGDGRAHSDGDRNRDGAATRLEERGNGDGQKRKLRRRRPHRDGDRSRDALQTAVSFSNGGFLSEGCGLGRRRVKTGSEAVI